jgi:hypothetical protein
MEHNDRYSPAGGMNRHGKTRGMVLRVVLVVFTILVLLNGILLLCESDPIAWYKTFFGF